MREKTRISFSAKNAGKVCVGHASNKSLFFDCVTDPYKTHKYYLFAE